MSAPVSWPIAPGRRLVRGHHATPVDPREPLEIALPRRGRDALDFQLHRRPFRPTRPDEIPAPALPALEATCGPLHLDRLFVVPRTTRLIAHNRCVITPAEVLAFGDEAVGLWIDVGPAGRVLSVPVDGLVAVDDRRILLHGRLRLVADTCDLVVRYGTVSQEALEENLSVLRRRMATGPLPVEPGFVWPTAKGAGMGQADLPFKWRLLLGNPRVRPDRDEPVVVAVGEVAEIRPRDRRLPSGVAVLGPRELVIATEPAELIDCARYGVDLVAVPRRRLDALAWDGRSLTVFPSRDGTASGGAAGHAAGPISLALDGHLVEAMRRAFGSAVRWAKEPPSSPSSGELGSGWFRRAARLPLTR